MNLIVERVGDEVKQMAGELVQLLPRVWSRAEGQGLLRMQVNHGWPCYLVCRALWFRAPHFSRSFLSCSVGNHQSTLELVALTSLGHLSVPFTAGLHNLWCLQLVIVALLMGKFGTGFVLVKVLAAYQYLLNAIGPETPKTFSWLVPMVAYSVNPEQAESLVLLEDGLNLWLVALRNTPDSLGGPLLDMFPYLVQILQRSTGKQAFIEHPY